MRLCWIIFLLDTKWGGQGGERWFFQLPYIMEVGGAEAVHSPRCRAAPHNPLAYCRQDILPLVIFDFLSSFHQNGRVRFLISSACKFIALIILVMLTASHVTDCFRLTSIKICDFRYRQLTPSEIMTCFMTLFTSSLNICYGRLSSKLWWGFRKNIVHILEIVVLPCEC